MYRTMRERITRTRDQQGRPAAKRCFSLVVTAQLYECAQDYAAAQRMTIRDLMEEALSRIEDVTVDDIKMERIRQITVESDAEMRDMNNKLTVEGYERLSMAALDLGTNRRVLMRVLLHKCLGTHVPQELE